MRGRGEWVFTAKTRRAQRDSREDAKGAGKASREDAEARRDVGTWRMGFHRQDAKGAKNASREDAKGCGDVEKD